MQAFPDLIERLKEELKELRREGKTDQAAFLEKYIAKLKPIDPPPDGRHMSVQADGVLGRGKGQK